MDKDTEKKAVNPAENHTGLKTEKKRNFGAKGGHGQKRQNPTGRKAPAVSGGITDTNGSPDLSSDKRVKAEKTAEKKKRRIDRAPKDQTDRAVQPVADSAAAAEIPLPEVPAVQAADKPNPARSENTNSPAETTNDKAAEEAKKKKGPRNYDEIMEDLSSPEAKNVSPIDRFVGLLMEVKAIKDLPSEKIPFFFASVHDELAEEFWAPFLTKAFLNTDSNEPGNDKQISDEIQKCCSELLEDRGLRPEDLMQAFIAFRESKDPVHITDYLSKAEHQDPSADEKQETVRKITAQELACAAYTRFIYECQSFAPSNYDLQIKAERAIAEYFGKAAARDQVGKTVGSVLAVRAYSPKRIADLTYLYAGTLDTIRQQSQRITELTNQCSTLNARISALTEETAKWKVSHADMITRIESLEREGERLRKERSDAESMLDYERNRYERQMQTKEAGIAEQLAGEIALELEAIRETLSYVDEDNQRRIRRRLQRIGDILTEFGGNANA